MPTASMAESVPRPSVSSRTRSAIAGVARVVGDVEHLDPVARASASRSGTRSMPITRAPLWRAIRADICPIGPRPKIGHRPALGNIGVLDRLPRGRQDVGEVEEAFVGRALGHLDRAELGLRYAQVLGLAARHLAVELRVAEERGAGAGVAVLRRLALRESWRLHIQQCPQEMLNGITTRSPGEMCSTSEPTSSTTPIGS